MWIAFGKVQPSGDRRGWPLKVCFCKIIHPCFEKVQIEANSWIRLREILYSTVYTSVRSSSLKPVCGSLSQVGIYKYPITLSLGYRCRRQAGPPPIKGGWTGWLLLNAPSSLLLSGSASSPHFTATNMSALLEKLRLSVSLFVSSCFFAFVISSVLISIRGIQVGLKQKKLIWIEHL